jgi:hypothetical protein
MAFFCWWGNERRPRDHDGVVAAEHDVDQHDLRQGNPELRTGE